MRAYLITTGTVFGLITMAHVVRVVEEGRGLLREPWFMLLTLATSAMSLWAVRLPRTTGMPRAGHR